VKRAHKIRLYPNNMQKTQLRKHCGCARLAYNVCLAKWDEEFASGGQPNHFGIKKWFNHIKKERFPFMYEVSKWAVEAAIADLGAAFRNFFDQNAEHPKFHKKGIKDSFRIDGSVFKVKGKMLLLPKKLGIRMAEGLRFPAGRIYNVTVSERAGMWFASFQCEVPERENQAPGMVGVDLGLKSQAVLSDGTVYPNLGLSKRYAKQLARAQRNLSRKTKGSQSMA